MLFIGAIVNKEDLQLTKLIGFAFIWTALGFLSRDLYRSTRSLDNSQT